MRSAWLPGWYEVTKGWPGMYNRSHGKLVEGGGLRRIIQSNKDNSVLLVAERSPYPDLPEEHKKKHPDSSVNFAEFSKKCSERWKTMSAKEKSKFEDMAKSDKVRYDREMKSYVPPKGDKKGKKKDPNAPKRPPSAFFLFCSEHRPKIKSEHPGLSIGDTAKKLGEMWSEQSAKDKQPYEQKAAKLKEKYEKDIAAYRAKGKSEAGKKGPGRPTGSKKNEPEDEEEEEEEDEDEE
ncbi:High mobility group protein B2 [Tupaia chinensis]|uniref:High mobility group protein B2 n=1 Tax=Tupaia chinensis TaxID=246437 RepID=L9LDQ4_TUPCH|nr:High mobility group protein B2 [Tupaia chinensis]